jgi:hypothetical protein
MSAVVITVISIVFVMLSCVLFYFLAKSRADKGMLPQGKDWDRSRIPISLVFDYEGFRYIITRMKFVYAEALRFYNREVGPGPHRPNLRLRRQDQDRLHHHGPDAHLWSQ